MKPETNFDDHDFKKNGRVRTVILNPPSLQDNIADAERLTGALAQQLKTRHIYLDQALMPTLSRRLRKWDYQARCLFNIDGANLRVSHLMGPRDDRILAGVAVDLGTSRIVLRLVNLADGQHLAETSFDNPQINIAPDVLARIHFCETGNDGLSKLRSLVVDALNSHIKTLVEDQGLSVEDVYFMTMAGNTTMTHLFLGLDPHWLIREPYIPVVNRPGLIGTRSLGIKIHPRANIYIFPNIGSYFGGDLIAGILYSGLYKSEETAILVDVGTNAEVVLGNKDWMMACAGAAGPALEGGVTKMGMMAGSGAIDRIKIDPVTGEFKIHIIDEIQPVGICGSGVIDLAAALFKAGLVDIRGKLIPKHCQDRFSEKNGIQFLQVVPAKDSATKEDLAITQADLDSLIRSKAAMYTILETISTTMGISLADLSTFYIAGTFGSFINPESAITIGMIPDLPLERYHSLGNSSLGGASMALLSHTMQAKAEKIRDEITYLELNVNQEFMNRFSAAKFLPHTDPGRFPSVKNY